MRSLFALALASIPVLACLASAPLRAQVGGACPHERASAVPAASQDLAPWRTCHMRVRIFRIEIAIPNGRCPTGRTHVAAHEECLGAFGENTACGEAGIVPIELETCRCERQTGSWVAYSACVCRAAGAMGFVMQGQTVECH